MFEVIKNIFFQGHLSLWRPEPDIVHGMSGNLQSRLWGQNQTFLEKKNLGTFPAMFVETKSRYFSWEVGPSPAMFEVVKTIYF